MNPFKKIIFLLKKPPVIIVAGKSKSRDYVAGAISRILRNNVLIFGADLSDEKRFKKLGFFLKKSRMPILVVKELANFQKLARFLPAKGFLIFNYDDEAAREINEELLSRSLSYGFQKKADLQADDVNIDSNLINFKVYYQGSVVPFWLRNISGREQINEILPVIAAGLAMGINLVEISQSLK